jgi:hypothetical protein
MTLLFFKKRQGWSGQVTEITTMAMKFAFYSMKTSSLPDSLNISENTEALANKPLPLYSMRKEFEVRLFFHTFQ